MSDARAERPLPRATRRRRQGRCAARRRGRRRLHRGAGRGRRRRRAGGGRQRSGGTGAVWPAADQGRARPVGSGDHRSAVPGHRGRPGPRTWRVRPGYPGGCCHGRGLGGCRAARRGPRFCRRRRDGCWQPGFRRAAAGVRVVDPPASRGTDQRRPGRPRGHGRGARQLSRDRRVGRWPGRGGAAPVGLGGARGRDVRARDGRQRDRDPSRGRRTMGGRPGGAGHPARPAGLLVAGRRAAVLEGGAVVLHRELACRAW